MRKRMAALLLILCLALSLAAPAAAVEISEGESWKLWSQSDKRWAELSISSQGIEKYSMKAQGCLVTAIAKVLVYSGQQSADSFTPEDCLNAMHKYNLLGATGALLSGQRMNDSGFLAEFGPQLTYYTDPAHSPWGQETAYRNLAEKIQDNFYIIIRAFNRETGNYHYMTVDSLSNGRIYVMDNRRIVDLYGDGQYAGVSDWLCFRSRGPGMPPVTEPEGPAGLLSNFAPVRSYQNGIFSDVTPGNWYRDSVARAYELDLVHGEGNGSFGVKSKFTLAAALTLAARMHSIYYTGTAEFEQLVPWYGAYVDYAVDKGIIAPGRFGDYGRPATRAEMAEIFSAALPEEALQSINQVPDGAIPDVPMSAPYAQAVYRLYRAGILTGDVGTGAFRPGDQISRAEAASLAARMADPELRQSVELG